MAAGEDYYYYMDGCTDTYVAFLYKYSTGVVGGWSDLMFPVDPIGLSPISPSAAAFFSPCGAIITILTAAPGRKKREQAPIHTHVRSRHAEAQPATQQLLFAWSLTAARIGR